MTKVSKQVLYYFYLLLSISNLISINSHKLKKCGHNLRALRSKSIRVNYHGNEHNETSKLRYLQATWEPLRMYIDYSMLDAQTTVDIAKRNAIHQVVDATKAMFEKLLMVKRLTAKLKVTTCEDITSISPAVQAGVSADIVIFPVFDLTAAEGVEASAVHCNQDTITNRPTAGGMFYAESVVDPTRKNYMDYLIMLTFHEMTHILVFNDSLYEGFIDSTGQVIPVAQTVGTQTINGVSRSMITSPKVVATAKSHFGCSKIIGMELENQGGEGTAGAHWEMRTMLGDYMIGESYDENVISEISLAFYEDSGWYKTNYYTGGLFRYGKYKGCDFLLSKCIVNEKSNFPGTFCTESGARMCTSSRIAKGTCSIQDSTETVDAAYKYFTSGKVGTTNADFCPITASADDAAIYFAQVCFEGLSSLPVSLNEVIGADSSCFYSSIKDPNITEQKAIPTNYSICYKHSCDLTAKTLSVTVGTQTISCSRAGGPVDVTVGTSTGKLWCPDYNLICTQSVPCSGAVDCAMKGSSPLSPTYDYTSLATDPFGTDSASAASPIPSPVPAGTPGVGDASIPANGYKITILSTIFYFLIISFFA